jgi:hypothetical protein
MRRSKQRAASPGKRRRSKQDPDALSWVRPDWWPASWPADLKPVVVAHPSLTFDTLQVFTERLVVGWEELWRRIGFDPSKADEQLRDRVFASAKEKVLPLQAIERLRSGDNQERARVLEQAMQEFRTRMLQGLAISPPRKGRKRQKQNEDRDSQIYELYQQGLSHGEIVMRLALPRNEKSRQLVKAAWRREVERRKELYQQYRELKRLLHEWGLLLVEEPPK